MADILQYQKHPRGVATDQNSHDSAIKNENNMTSLELMEKCNPELLTKANEYPTSYNALKEALQIENSGIHNESRGNYSTEFADNSNGHESFNGNNTMASINTTNIIDHYYEPSAIDIEDSIIYDAHLNGNDDILLKREDYFLQLKLCTEYAIYKAKQPTLSLPGSLSSIPSPSQSVIGLSFGMTDHNNDDGTPVPKTNASVSNRSSGMLLGKFDYEDDEHFIRNWRYLMKELKNAELLQKELLKNGLKTLEGSQEHAIISNMEKILVLKDRLNNGLLRQLSKISFPDLNVDVQDYLNYSKIKKNKARSHYERSSKYKHRNKSNDNFRLLSGSDVKNGLFTPHSHSALSARNTSFGAVLDQPLKYPVDGGANTSFPETDTLSTSSTTEKYQHYQDLDGVINSDMENTSAEDSDGLEKAAVDGVTSYLISEMIKHNLELPISDSSDTYNNQEFLKSCIDSLIHKCALGAESSETLSKNLLGFEKKSGEHSVTGQNNINGSSTIPRSVAPENRDITTKTSLPISKDHLTESSASRELLQQNENEINDLKTALKDLQLAHNFLTDKFAKDRFESTEKIDKLTKKSAKLTNELTEFQTNLQYEQDKYLKIVHQMNEKDNTIESLQSKVAQLEQQAVTQTALPSPGLPHGLASSDTDSIHSTTPNGSPASTGNSSSYSISLMRQEFKKIVQQMNTKHEIELQREIEKRLKLEKRLQQ
ncbi:hypothetical protein ACO0QE_002848 [Hanseniaspora vineae]